MLGSTLILTLLPVLALASPGLGARGDHHDKDVQYDKFGGKTLTPSNYTVVPGLFVQDDPAFNSTGYDALKDSFGLIDKSPKRWKNFEKKIKELNKKADKYTTYKVVYIARHGEGYHNVAESMYGSPAWNCYWSLLNGDGNMTWYDAEVTPKGIEQAKAVNAGWKEQLKAGIPLPQTWYTSPMRRAASTVQITWDDIVLNKGKKAPKPIVKEHLREMIGLHTCDRRHTKSEIAKMYPGFAFEPAFAEHDVLWGPVYQESQDQHALRLRLVMNEIFATDPSTFISITAHSGVINAFFRSIGHRAFSVQTGGMVPVVIKAVSYPDADNVPITGGPSNTAPVCTADPTAKVQPPATVTVTPTWYPSCADAPATTSAAPTGCLGSPVSGPTGK